MVSVLLLLICLGAVAAWVGIRGTIAYGHLISIREESEQIAGLIPTNPDAALKVAETISQHAKEAQHLTSDPVWKVAESAPWLGPQLTAFSAVARSANTLADGTLPLLKTPLAAVQKALQPVESRLDTSNLIALRQPASKAADASREAADNLNAVPRTALLKPVADAVEQAQQSVDTVADALDGFSRATRLLPSLLPPREKRVYLLLVQNNAEWRSLGGISGTAILMTATDGRIVLERNDSAARLSNGLRDSPAADLPNDVQQVFGTRPARYFHNLTQIPDFTIDGPLARQMYKLQTGVNVDGVIAVDPVALSYLLSATGPVMTASGDTLTSDNAVPLLLNEVYFRYSDPATQDEFFSQAARSVFTALMQAHSNVPVMLTALGRGLDERRILMWSADEDDQSVIAGTSLAGELPRSNGRDARFGVFLNDGTGSKMSYYTRPDVSLSWGSCLSGAPTSRELTLELLLSNGAPLDAQKTLPSYVTGNGSFGTPPGSVTTVANILLPTGWELQSTSVSPGKSFTEGLFRGRQVLTVGFTLAPGSSDSITVTVLAPDLPATGAATVTPTADASLSPTVRASCPENAGLSLH